MSIEQRKGESSRRSRTAFQRLWRDLAEIRNRWHGSSALLGVAVVALSIPVVVIIEDLKPGSVPGAVYGLPSLLAAVGWAVAIIVVGVLLIVGVYRLWRRAKAGADEIIHLPLDERGEQGSPRTYRFPIPMYRRISIPLALIVASWSIWLVLTTPVEERQENGITLPYEIEVALFVGWLALSAWMIVVRVRGRSVVSNRGVYVSSRLVRPWVPWKRVEEMDFNINGVGRVEWILVLQSGRFFELGRSKVTARGVEVQGQVFGQALDRIAPARIRRSAAFTSSVNRQ